MKPSSWTRARTLPPLCLVWACASVPAAADPAAQSAVTEALKAVDAQPGYRARYEARIARSGSDPFQQKGAAVRQGTLLYREGRFGGDPEIGVRLYRGNNRVAVYDLRTDQWMTGEQAGDPTLGKGLEDPDVAMALLRDAVTDAAKGTAEAGGDVYALTLDKARVARKVREQSEAAEELDWEKAEVNAQVVIGGAPPLPLRFRINGVLPARERDGGTVTLHIAVEVEAYGDQPLQEKMPKEAKEILGLP